MTNAQATIQRINATKDTFHDMDNHSLTWETAASGALIDIAGSLASIETSLRQLVESMPRTAE